MNTIKGFISIGAITDNAVGQTAIFGELSDLSRTYSRTKKEYVDAANYPNVRLDSFLTVNGAGSDYSPTTIVTGHILSVANWIYGQHQASTIPSNANKTVFINSLSTQFPDMTNIVINEILNGSPSTKRMPDFVEWHYDDSGVDTLIKIWFSDTRFRSQYVDDYEIFVVPPITPINQLNNTQATVNALLATVTNASIFNAVTTIQGSNPATAVSSYVLTWNDPGAGVGTLSTEWTIVSYGIGGQDTENIKNAIREYISANSVLTVWPDIYPSLYAENEFTIIPLWNDTAVPEAGLDVELYRGAVHSGSLASIATARIPPAYSQSVVISSFLNTNMAIASTAFRSLSVLAVGNPNNINGDFNFIDKYPDYLTAITSSPDWLRMSLNTRNFITQLNDALEKAITLTNISAVPVGYTRVIKNSKVYLSFIYQGFTYLVLSKNSY